MKAQVNREALGEAVDLAQGVVDPRNIKPVLQDIFFDFTAEGLEVAATNLDVGIRVLLKDNIQTEEAGAVALPAGEIASILRESPDETLAFESEEEFCHIRGADSRYRIAGDDPSDFPGIGATPEGKPVQIEAVVLAEMIKKTRFAAASEAMRYALNGVLLTGKSGDKNVEMIGADGRRLANIKRKANAPNPFDIRAIVSLRGIALMERILGGREGAVQVLLGERQIWLIADDVCLVAQLVEGHYPNYEEVIPDDCDKKALVNRDAMLSGVRRASVVVTEESHAVNLTFESNTLILTSDTPERGSARIQIEAQYDGDPVTMRFNPDYIVDMLKVAEDEDIVVEFKEASRPALLRSGRNYRCLIMPITDAQA